MTTEMSTVNSSLSPCPLSERTAPNGDHTAQLSTVAHIYWGHAPEEHVAKAVHIVIDELVALVEDNPKVWALHAKQDGTVIRVWTYVDSDNRRDRSPVYAAEWELLSRYPELAFDFNVVLSPAGSVELEGCDFDYLWKR